MMTIFVCDVKHEVIIKLTKRKKLSDFLKRNSTILQNVVDGNR